MLYLNMIYEFNRVYMLYTILKSTVFGETTCFISDGWLFYGHSRTRNGNTLVQSWLV